MRQPKPEAGKFHAENSICTPADCSYVASMNWQQLITLSIVLAVAILFVWRSSGKKSGHGSGCNCGCPHDHADDASVKSAKKAEPASQSVRS